MHRPNAKLTRRRVLKTAVKASAVLAAPMFVPGRALGRDGAVSASERIVLGGIGIGNRGRYDLTCFLAEADVQFVAICDVRADNLDRARKMVDDKYDNTDCATYRDMHELLARDNIDAVLIATGPNWHATAACVAARAGKDVYCEKPCTKNIVQSLALRDTFRRTGRVFQAGTQRRSLPNFMYAIDLARRGKLGKLHTVHAQPLGLKAEMSTWLPAEPLPPKDRVDYDRYLGPAAWRPYNRKILDGFNFEKGGGFVGAFGAGGCLEWGSHCVDLCQWANDADDTAPVEYEQVGKEVHAVYPNGVKLVMRDERWLPNMGSCPVRFEGDAGWVETGDNAEIVAEPVSLLATKTQKVKGYPANFHVRNFLDCVKSRGKPRASAEAACQAHIACHAANIALLLKRKLKFDPVNNVFINDDEANRLRSEATRAPWWV